MRVREWWRNRSGISKTLTVLAAMLILQIGLCFSTDTTVLPLYKAVYGPSSDSEIGLGLMIWQGILGAGTFVVFVIVGLLWLAERSANKN